MSRKPNILCILAEDICPNLGCYGDKDAITPNIDSLAEKGMRYSHASSVGPICAPARTTLALGIYPPSLGAQHMRSNVAKPDNFRIISEYLQDAGYFCAINKTDYNFRMDNKSILKDRPAKTPPGWDRSIPGGGAADTADISRKVAGIWRIMLTVREEILLIMSAVDTMDRLGEKADKLLYLIKDLKENIYAGNFTEMERYTQTISPSVRKLFEIKRNK